MRTTTWATHLRNRAGSTKRSLLTTAALAITPDHADAHYDLGTALHKQGRLDEAIAAYTRALAITPDDSRMFSNLLFCLLYGDSLAPPALFAAHGAFAEHFEAPLSTAWQPHVNTTDPGRRLRVGFVSGDFRNHAVANFIEPVWAALDPAQLELWAYSSHHEEDAVTLRLRQYIPHWRKVAGLSDAVLAEQIRADGIDILVDLSGHTAHNRLLTFARKPAPVQATWIGYPGTTGLAAVDYLICDRFNAPHGLYERYYTEQFARLPAQGHLLPIQVRRQ